MRSETILQALESSGVRLGLDRMGDLLEVLDRPHEAFPVVLVAGTNGKGSISTFLSSFAVAASYRTGLYTSPHLESPTERVRVDGLAVDDEDLAQALDGILAAAAEAGLEPPTYFEAMTLAALLIFRQQKVHLAVLEVGLGGRLDATNVCEPILGVVTPISLDHCAILGNDLASIAGEKAGIFRPEKTFVIAPQEAEARDALGEAAQRVGADLVDVQEAQAVDAIQRLGSSTDGPVQRVWLRSDRERQVFELALPGRFQAENLAVAVVAARRLEKLGFDRLSLRPIMRGAAAARWPGRCEWISLPAEGAQEGPRVLLDVAHNPAGAAALLEILDRLEEPFDLLFGVRQDKDLEAILPGLAAKARRLILTRPTSDKGRSPAEYAALLKHSDLIVEEDWKRGLDVLLEGLEGLEGIADPEGGNHEPEERAPSTTSTTAVSESAPVAVVCGSIYLVGAVREELTARFGVPRAAVKVRLGPEPKKRSGSSRKKA